MPGKSPISITGMLLAALLVGCDTAEKVTNSTPVATASIQLTSPSSVISTGGTLQLQAVPMSSSGKPLTARSSQVTWTSSNTAVASVSGSGLLTGLIGGQTTVTASQGGASANVAVTVNNPAPSITSVTPTGVMAGDTAFNLRVLGSGFVSNSVVRWNGSDRTTTFVSSGELRARINAADIASPATATVTVSTPAPGGGTSAGAAFAVSDPVPVVTTLPADSVTSTGARILGTVKQDGRPYTVWIEWGTSPTLASASRTNGGTGPAPGCPTTCTWFVKVNTLQPGTTYYYRMVAQNIAGIGQGAILSFTTPAANNAPVISALTTTSTLVNACTNGGTNFTYSFNYSDPDGDVPASGAYVSDDWSYQPSGTSGTLLFSNFTRTGTGFSGTVSVSVCSIFNSDTSVTNRFTLRDLGGHVSNALSLTSSKPAGANSVPGTPAVTTAPGAAPGN